MCGRRLCPAQVHEVMLGTGACLMQDVPCMVDSHRLIGTACGADQSHAGGCGGAGPSVFGGSDRGWTTFSWQ